MKKLKVIVGWEEGNYSALCNDKDINGIVVDTHKNLEALVRKNNPGIRLPGYRARHSALNPLRYLHSPHPDQGWKIPQREGELHDRQLVHPIQYEQGEDNGVTADLVDLRHRQPPHSRGEGTLDLHQC